ncbi:MAG: hypothetical protein J6C40_09840 [Lentisphaeria bacterium]|nr:hypothetical protein [Lentisphaeria bacterium]
MASGDFPLSWNEFQWEEEIRRDERRINGYFRDLPSCLDLPGEEDMIYEKLFSRTELMPIQGKTGALRNWEEDENNDEDEGNSAPTHKLLVQLDCLAVEWNIITVNTLFPAFAADGLKIACAYGKLIVRTANFLEERQMDFSLRISLGKRCLADLNDLAGSLTEIGRKFEELHDDCRTHLEMLGHVREQLLLELKTVRDDIPF